MPKPAFTKLTKNYSCYLKRPGNHLWNHWPLVTKPKGKFPVLIFPIYIQDFSVNSVRTKALRGSLVKQFTDLWAKIIIHIKKTSKIKKDNILDFWWTFNILYLSFEFPFPSCCLWSARVSNHEQMLYFRDLKLTYFTSILYLVNNKSQLLYKIVFSANSRPSWL